MTNAIKVLRLAGRAVNGTEGGRGVKYHAVPERSDTALCGATYGRRSAGWSEYAGPEVTCPRCLSKLKKMTDKELAAPGAPDLLAVAKEIATGIQMFEDGRYTDEEAMADILDHADALRKAIAAAPQGEDA